MAGGTLATANDEETRNFLANYQDYDVTRYITVNSREFNPLSKSLVSPNLEYVMPLQSGTSFESKCAARVSYCL